MEVVNILIEQFKNLFDPSTALGAFLISFAAGIAGSFFGGYKLGKYVKKNNCIDISDSVEGDITQDVHRESGDNKNTSSKEVKTNNIHAKNVKGNITQDSEK